VNLDLTQEPLGRDPEGRPVFLRDLWPSPGEIREILDRHLNPRVFRERYADVFQGSEMWNAMPSGRSELYSWDDSSTYIQEPPFFTGLTPLPRPFQDIADARVLVMFGDSVTTDHISPAGAIAAESPAGRYLMERGVQPRDFNSYGSRRGNDRVMTRGTFANIRLRNLLVPGVEGGITVHFPDGEKMPVFDAAIRYRDEGVPLIILAGREYGTGSSRDWAAKGTLLLGVRAVLAESFERIHRSNLVGMGVLPLQYLPGQSAKSLGLTGNETFSIRQLERELKPSSALEIRARNPEGKTIRFRARARIDTPAEFEYYRNAGILQTALRKILADVPLTGQP
jgi:aconitate hydratase